MIELDPIQAAERQEARRRLNATIDAFQSFVAHTSKLYYKQDSDRALSIAQNLKSFEALIERHYSK